MKSSGTLTLLIVMQQLYIHIMFFGRVCTLTCLKLVFKGRACEKIIRENGVDF